MLYNSKERLCHIGAADCGQVKNQLKRLQTIVVLMLHVSFTLSHAACSQTRFKSFSTCINLSIQYEEYFIQIWHLLSTC